MTLAHNFQIQARTETVTSVHTERQMIFLHLMAFSSHSGGATGPSLLLTIASTSALHFCYGIWSRSPKNLGKREPSMDELFPQSKILRRIVTR